MNSKNCEHCNANFKTKSALNNHKNKAKYCLIIQGKIEPVELIISSKRVDLTTVTITAVLPPFPPGPLFSFPFSFVSSAKNVFLIFG